MKKLFIISPCAFTRKGFSNLELHEKMSDVEIINVESYEEVVAHIEMKAPPSGPALIIVDMTIRLRTFRTRQLANVWNLRRMMYTNPKLRKVPCVLFGIKEQSRLTLLHWISSDNSIESLIGRIDNIYKKHEEYSSSNGIMQKGLEKRQRMLLELLMKGYSIQKLSVKMHTCPHSLFYSRDCLIAKLGLYDRYDFIALSEDLIL
ncbi:hypothetical protein NWJ10_001701 [Salmonella enterica]|uniref:hypothetical protein n=1 Tax=Salmonella enterica TaxID=28901 RepID=UPI000D571C46|nr:hypothetical protein [Salmonella enterica]EAA5616305.1 hypothetical protein [Salmonella enterica subsp. enterica serovar Bredeney]EBU7716631.1 hypothetical protein [Salmonella enterica subsp. enterica serovar Thompson]ECB3311029.1 hypothetical protein [Salmonella enterica subsp. enterica serovar Mikawasima]ECU9703335.1 hypothetical protein [Salmonella enterica subsp. enterica serovar Panama]EDF6784811.1 hypothetical protein [Salmonella enterica subsp. enterica serovar Senftenberg]PVS97202.